MTFKLPAAWIGCGLVMIAATLATADVVVDMPAPPKVNTSEKIAEPEGDVDAGVLALRRYTRARTGTYNTSYSLPRYYNSSYASWYLGPYYRPYWGNGYYCGSGLNFGWGFVNTGVFWNRNVVISGPGFSVTH